MNDKRITQLLLSTVSALLLATPYAYGDSARAVEIDRLVALVLTESPEVKVSQTLVDQAQARLDSARSKYLPKPSGSISYFNQDQSGLNNANNNPGIPNFGFGGQTGFTAKVGVSLNVFNGFQDRHRELQRENELAKSNRDVQATRLSQFEKAIGSICTILKVQSDIKNIEEKIAIESERARDLRRKVDGQVAKRSDLLSIEASILGSESDLQNARAELDSEWRSLRSLSDAEIPYDVILGPQTELAPISDLREVASLPELRSAELDLRASALAAKASRGAFLPSLDVSFNRYFIRPDIQRDNRWDVQATLTIPFPFDAEKQASTRESDAAEIQKEATLNKKRKEKSIELEKLVLNYNAGIRRLRILSEAVELQSKLMEALKKDYQFGLASISDYLNAVSTLLQKKQERDHLYYQELQRAHQIRQYRLVTGEKS